jgi:hypothetical protein
VCGGIWCGDRVLFLEPVSRPFSHAWLL